MLTRRSFLLGGAGAVVAAGVGVELAGRDRVLHKLGLVGSPDHRVPPSGWAVDEEHLRGGTPFAWTRPPDGDVAGAVICLHGKGDTHRFAFDEIHLHDVVADEGAQLAVAALDGGEGSYWHPRADGTDPTKAVLDELVPFLRSELGLERFALLGWSMGGYGALLLGERHPELFPVVVGSSPALYPSFAAAAPGAFDDAAQFERDDVLAGIDALDPSNVRIDCGRQDPFAAADRRFVERLGPKATSSFPRGYHDAAFWRSLAPGQVRFVQERLQP